MADNHATLGKRILIVGAHPDDLEMNAGGTMAKLLKAGVDVRTMVLGNVDHQGNVAYERMTESHSAHAALGSAIDIQWGYGQDTKLQSTRAQLIAKVDGVVKSFRPDTVITHYWADTHQDHVTTYEVVAAAARNVPNMLLFKPTFPSGRTDVPFHPTLVSKLDEGCMRAKMEAMACFKSQMGKYGEDMWLESLRATAAGDAWTYGGFHGWAELFQVSRLLA